MPNSLPIYKFPQNSKNFLISTIRTLIDSFLLFYFTQQLNEVLREAVIDSNRFLQKAWVGVFYKESKWKSLWGTPVPDDHWGMIYKNKQPMDSESHGCAYLISDWYSRKGLASSNCDSREAYICEIYVSPSWKRSTIKL